jgi:hypothetical protein
LLHVDLGAVVVVATVAEDGAEGFAFGQFFDEDFADLWVEAGGEGVAVHEEHGFAGNLLLLDGQGQIHAPNSTIDTSHAMYTTVGGNIFGGGGTGNLSMTNSTFTPHNFYVGYLFNGTATFLNCSNVFGYGLTMGGASLAVGNMSIQGGSWIATNTYSGPDSPLINLGVNGTGNLTISNASVQLGATAIPSEAIRPHGLRATAATNALEHGADIAKVQEWLGAGKVQV